ncbi:MAG: trigger factor [Candidatus Komeilibacteria bacterium]|nr:trigger factor [Candidatus Komeilibacteria bacterium]
MNITENKTAESAIEFVIELDRAEIEKDLQKTARHLGEHVSVPGFRPGTAPYDILCRQLGGEAKVYEEALNAIISRTLPQIIIDKKLEIMGRPEVSMQKITPPFGIAYKAVINLLPMVVLGDITKIKAESKAVKVDPAEIEKTINQLLEMRMSETAVDRPAKLGDKAVLDFEVKKDNVVIEGGQAKDYHLVLGSDQFIPGFEEQVVGIKPNEEKTFTLSFPENYPAKHLAGAPADFAITVKQIFERTRPELTDEFAQNLGGYETADKLREQVVNNLQQEKEASEKERFELACMEELLKISTVGALPAKAVDEETEKMVHELEHNITDRGLKFADYLQSIKKSKEDLIKEFQPRAEHRLQISLVARVVGRQEQVKVTDDEVNQEIEISRKLYGHSPEVLAQFASADYRDYVRNVLTSRKIFATLADKVRKR